MQKMEITALAVVGINGELTNDANKNQTKKI